MLDNSALIEPFVPAKDDGDTFIYTEMLDRGQKKGNNGMRLLKTFYHRSLAEFREQMPAIRKWCDLAKVRACTRLAPRSYKKVGQKFTELVVGCAMDENWAGMKSLYNRACGITSPNLKLWIWDIDAPDARSDVFEKWLQAKVPFPGAPDQKTPLWVATLPTKKGQHFISIPFDVRLIPEELRIPGDNVLHKDNPTNLYIPDGAD